MAFVDLARDRLILKGVVAGPPAVGKSTGLDALGAIGALDEFGSKVAGRTRVVTIPLPTDATPRRVEVELYEWHGPERADRRGGGLFTGLDGVVYFADARADRLVDTIGAFKLLVDRAGMSRLRRLPALLVLGRSDEGLLTLSALAKELTGPTWTQQIPGPLVDAPGFVEAARLLGEVMLARAL